MSRGKTATLPESKANRIEKVGMRDREKIDAALLFFFEYAMTLLDALLSFDCALVFCFHKTFILCFFSKARQARCARTNAVVFFSGRASLSTTSMLHHNKIIQSHFSYVIFT